jgi:hypothetical protein
MATTTISPNMLLPVPVVGVDSGPDYATQVNNSLNIIDSHNHSLNSGVQITPSGLNINSDLSIQGHNLTSANSLNFINLTSTPTLAVGSLYELNNNLYWYSGGSLTVQMTNGGSLNVTSSGISSGTATASFVGGVLVVNEASNTPANIQAGSILFGNNISGSNFITLEPPSALASSYTLTLPAFNSSGNTQVMVLDTSGNMGSVSYDTVGQDMTSVGANAIASTRTRAVGSTVAAGGVAISASCGNYTVQSSLTAVTNLSVTLTTTGRPVMLQLISDSSGNISTVTNGLQAPAGAILEIVFNNSSTGAISYQSFNNQLSNTSGPISALGLPVSSFTHIDTSISGSAGTYTYSVSASWSGAAASSLIKYAKLIAYEL